MSLFNFNIEEIMTFFAVLVRYSILFSVLPFVGDRMVPGPVKILLAFVISITLFPALVASGRIHPVEASIWGATPGGIFRTIGLEVLFGLALGYSARLIFDGISIGANLVGNFMGFASASSFDPHQESQTEVIAQIQTSIAMLLFLVLDGHHLMLRASLDSYKIVGLGRGNLSAALGQRLTQMMSEMFTFGIQIAAPVAISLFSVNIVFGIISKAMPQLNVFVLSFAVSALVGFLVIFLSIPEFQGVVGNSFSRIGDWMESVMFAMSSGR